MRALLPEFVDELDEFGVHEFYASGWVEPGGVRVDFVASVDGSAQAAGRSAGLQTPGDNRVFAAQRDLADVVLVGAGTAVTEGYRGVRVPDRRRALRRRFGLGDALPIAVVSRRLALEPDTPLFTEALPEAPTLVITCAAAPRERRDALAAVGEVLVCGDDAVDLALARRMLEERGLRRILCEGGPTLFADLAVAGVVDELCLSVTPFLVGPGPARILGGPAAWPAARDLRLVGLLEEDGALFGRYRIAKEDRR